MSTYKLNFEQIRQDVKLGTMLEALERGFEKFGIDFYLIGPATGRSLVMLMGPTTRYRVSIPTRSIPSHRY